MFAKTFALASDFSDFFMTKQKLKVAVIVLYCFCCLREAALVYLVCLSLPSELLPAKQKSRQKDRSDMQIKRRKGRCQVVGVFQ